MDTKWLDNLDQAEKAATPGHWRAGFDPEAGSTGYVMECLADNHPIRIILRDVGPLPYYWNDPPRCAKMWLEGWVGVLACLWRLFR